MPNSTRLRKRRTTSRRRIPGSRRLLGAKLLPTEAEVLVGFVLVNVAEAKGLGVGAMGGDHGERLLAAGERGGLDEGIRFHKRQTLTVGWGGFVDVAAVTPA